jgi:hypothetical protein
MMRGREPSRRSATAGAPAVAKPRTRRRGAPVDACREGATEASSQRNNDVDVNADPYEMIGLPAKVGRYINAVANGGAGAVGLLLSALTSSLCAN